MENIMEINNLSKSYGDFRLKNISFKLQRGYIMGFIGPNGAGKSTTIKLIMNLIRKDTGEIRIFGLDNTKHDIQIKNRIGFVYDENHYYEELTCNMMKNVIAPFYSYWDDKAFESYIKKFELPKDKKIKELSKGMKMKFSLAIALSHKAEFIIMDEPTSGLDPIFRSEVLQILQEVMEDESKAVFFSSHITSDLDRIADYITFIDKGEIVLNEAKDSIFESFCLIKGGRELLDRDIKAEFIGIKEGSFGFEGLMQDKKKARKLFGDSVLIEKPSLDEIMLYTVRGNMNV